MFPNIINVTTNLSVNQTMGKVFLFDLNTRQYVLKDGKPVEATYEEAILQWVAMVITTEKGKYGIYKDLDFGLNLVQFIGRKDLRLAVISSVIKTQIEEQLIKHPEIQSIENFSFSRSDGKGHIRFNVRTKQGLIEGIEKEVIYSG